MDEIGEKRHGGREIGIELGVSHSTLVDTTDELQDQVRFDHSLTKAALHAMRPEYVIKNEFIFTGLKIL